ncbi:DNA glycosylase [Xylaria grammica]|nr:DNA glycosylase [Xylaria grammica]
MDNSKRADPLSNANTRPIDPSNDFMFGFDVEDDDDKEYLAELAMYRIGHEDDIRGFIHLSLLRGAEEWDQAICCATAMKARGFCHDSLDGQDVLTFLAKFSSVYNSSHATTILSSPEKSRRPRAKRKSKRTCLSPRVEIQLDIPVNKQRKVQNGKDSPYWDGTCIPVRQQDSRSNDGPETTVTAKKAPMKFKGSLERAVSPTPTAPIEAPGDDTVVQTYRGSDSELTPITLDGQHELGKSVLFVDPKEHDSEAGNDITGEALGEPSIALPKLDAHTKQNLITSDVDTGKANRALGDERNLSTSQKQTPKREAKSPYFNTTAAVPSPPKLSKSPKIRPPRGTVSSLPFPRLDAPRFGLIQEELAHDPFRLLIAVTFLVRTSGKAAIPVFRALMAKYPTPSALAAADAAEIVAMIRHLGLGSVRAAAIQRYARVWLEDPPRNGVRHAVKNYHGAESPRTDEHGVLVRSGGDSAWEIGHMTQGPYALDSWRIFCRDVLRGAAEDWKGGGREGEFQPEWMRVLPQDKELRAYLRWMWMQEGWQWDPRTGEKVVLSEDLRRAVAEGRVGYDDTGDLRILDHAD